MEGSTFSRTAACKSIFAVGAVQLLPHCGRVAAAYSAPVRMQASRTSANCSDGLPIRDHGRPSAWHARDGGQLRTSAQRARSAQEFG
eukprot:scaffold7783_cov69-Phaeocystis_antarctica.AAC.2